MTVEKNDSIKEEANKQHPESTEHTEEEKSAELTKEETAETIFAEEQTEGQAVNEKSPSQEQLRALEKSNAELEKKLQEAGNRYLRLQADFENFKRRTRLDAAASEKYRAQELILNILPAIDNFERALQTEANEDQAKALKQGMEMVYRGLLDALEKEGLQVIEAVGKEFDPHLHHAVMQGQDENFASNIVIEEFQKGYMLKDRVIRPSMVKVNQ